MIKFENIEKDRGRENFRIERVLDKGVGLMNEDAILDSPEIFGAFDGATGLDKYIDPQGRTGGYLASQTAKEIFSRNDASLVDLAISANRKIREEMIDKKIDVDKRANLWCTTFAVARLKEKQLEWAQISDASILLIYRDGSFKILGGDYSFDRPSLVKWKELSDQGETEIGKKIQDQLIKVRAGANQNYGVLNGEENMINFLNSGLEPLDNVKDILIFSDGLLIPKTDPEAAEDFSAIVKLYLEGGLNRVKDYVRDLESSDPECRKFPRFKEHDDMAAVAISFSPSK
ncbi:MAG: hypothetical protein WC719_00040 [Patescibacteria group bacterium]|jgi:hypothetical protein